MKKTKIYLVLALITLVGGLSSCKKSSFGDTPSQVSLYQIIMDDYQFSQFRYMVNRAGLADQLKNGEFTVIGANNFAFGEMGYGTNTNTELERLNDTEITALAKNHIIAGKLDLNAISGSQEVQTLGKKIRIVRKNDDFYIDGGDITHLRVNATNGYFYVTNRLVMSETNSKFGPNIIETLKVRGNPLQFTYLIAALARSTTYTNLLTGSTAHTLFAPDNNAFIRGGYATVAAINAAPLADIEDILKRHIFAGAKLTSDFDSVAVNNVAGTPVYFDRDKPRTSSPTLNYANGVPFNPRGLSANVVHPNGGVFHIVSQLLPKQVIPTPNTLARIQADANLTFFAAAIDEASKKTGKTVDFIALLSGPRAFTVYAPTDDAFKAAGYATPAAVRNETIERLTALVQYHIINRRRAQWGIGDAAVSTLYATKNTSGVTTTRTIAITTTGGYTVLGAGNGGSAASVTTADVVTTNGMLNIIDKVLLP